MSPCLTNPLGFRIDGRPFWAFSGGDGEDGKDGGGSDTKSTTDVEEDDDEEREEKDPVKKLENTVKALRTERKAAQDELRPVKAVLRELGIDSPEALRKALTKESGGKEQQVDVEKVREEARREARLEANRDVALARAEAMASTMFEDPEDAVDFLRKNVDDLLDRDGKPDRKAIDRELGDLLEAKPHWGKKKAGDIGFDGGARQTGGGKVTMDGFLRQASRAKRGN